MQTVIVFQKYDFFNLRTCEFKNVSKTFVVGLEGQGMFALPKYVSSLEMIAFPSKAVTSNKEIWSEKDEADKRESFPKAPHSKDKSAERTEAKTKVKQTSSYIFKCCFYVGEFLFDRIHVSWT